MNDPKMIPLAKWVQLVRQELEHAQQARAEALKSAAKHGHAKFIGFRLEEVTLEAQVVTEVSSNEKMAVQVLVLSIGYDGTDKASTTQKVVLKFKPVTDDGQQIVLGENDQKDAFDE